IPSISGKEQVVASIIDMTGKVVSTTTIVGNNTQLDLSGFNKGLYFINLNINGVSVTKKLIVE
ncbi:MAG: T9SS type A sorting domain-containing protein, partial [Bacteroidota bacterium]